MKTILPLALALLTLGLVVGCETPGRSLAKSAVDQIRDGQTTQAEIDKTFGEPMQMSRSPEGRTLYYFQRYYGPDRVDSSGFAAPRRDEANLLILTVLFNSAGIVEKHLHSHTQPNIDRIQLSAGRKLGQDELKRIVPMKTTRAELGTWFGPHWSEELTLSGHRVIVWLYASGYNLSGGIEMQALEVVLDDAGTVHTYRVTKRDPWRN